MHIESYRTAPPVQFLGPLDEEEANKPVSNRGLRPGEARTAMRGDAAMVGEFHELWWAANGTAFAPTVEGHVEMDLRLVRLRMDTPGAIVNKVVRRVPGGNGVTESVSVDWTQCREEMHAKGWLRLDPVIRAHGLSEHGLLPDECQNQPEEARAFKGETGPMCDPEFLADVGRCNEVTYNEPYRQRMGSQAKAGLQSYLSTLRDSDDGRKERGNLLFAAGKASQKWRDALAEAQGLMDGGEPKGKAKAEPTGEDRVPARSFSSIALAYTSDADTREIALAALLSLPVDALRDAAKEVKVDSRGGVATLSAKLIDYLDEYKTRPDNT